jgi:hypothetical protein
MGLLNFSARIFARLSNGRIRSWRKNSVGLQLKEFEKLLEKGRRTSFGHEHSLDKTSSYERFKKLVPVRDYEGLRHYIGRIRLGEKDVLWPGKPIYFAKTSGTTSGGKYIPITRDSMPNHINSTRLALLNYIHVSGKSGFLEGKYIFLSGSPELERDNEIPSGRLSGIVNHHVPDYLQRNQLPSWKTNCLDDWSEKIDAIVEETINQKMSLISGIPPWVEMYFERLLRRSGKPNICELFPEFSLFIYGGVNFQPYEHKFRKLLGRDVDTLEIFPASEGFIAFQDEFPGNGLVLIPDAGIFYEFIPVSEFHNGNLERICLADVQTGINYLMIMNTNAGLWGYNIGDTVRFLSKDPYRITITGRVNQFISAFGEHVIAEEVESAVNLACNETGARINEFTVAPLVDNPEGKPCHEWFIEFGKIPSSLEHFRIELDNQLCERNSYYRDLIRGDVIQPLIIRVMPESSFSRYMSSIGKLGGQNKVPHLLNDRGMAEVLLNYLRNTPLE